MAIFGFICLIIFSGAMTLGTTWLLLHGGEEFSPAKFPVWLVCVPALIFAWWLIIKISPFTLTVSGA